MSIAASAFESWLLFSLVLLAGLECLTIIVMGRRSLWLAREQAASQRALDALRARLDVMPGLEHRFRHVVESDPDPVVCRDEAGRIVFANAAFAALMGDGGLEYRGSFASPSVVESSASPVQPDGSRLVDEAIATTGGTRWISWRERPIRSPEGTACVWRSGRDITERVAAERDLAGARAGAEAANVAKSRFLTTVSHEFRTPLNGIMGMSDLLLETAPTPEQASHIRTIRGSAEAFLGLIEEILDFSTIEAGRLSLRRAPLDLVQLVEGVAELLAPRAHGKGIDIASFVSCDVPRHVMGDRDRLRQILLNLAGNAVKFTQDGGIAITVERGAGGGICFSVEDSGPGIAADRREAIFEDFEQGSGGSQAHHEGTGLGLAITRRLVAAMGGSLALDTAPGSGSVFRVDLDLPAATVPERRRSADCRGTRVLVVSPSAIGLRLLARRLLDRGADAVGADTIGAACIALSRRPFDVLIVDVGLGIDAVREIAAAADVADVPRRIVMLSPYEKRAFGAAPVAGYDGYLTKPVRTRSLLQQVALQQVAFQPDSRSAASAPASRPADPRPGLLRVLLAEDNDVNALIAMRALEKIGATVDWARTGPEALALAEEALAGGRPPYDSILMDIRLPDLDGCEVTRRIRRIEARRGGDERSRIIAVSANVSAADQALARAAGLDAFMPKPFTLQMLRDCVLPTALAKAS